MRCQFRRSRNGLENAGSWPTRNSHSPAREAGSRSTTRGGESCAARDRRDGEEEDGQRDGARPHQPPPHGTATAPGYAPASEAATLGRLGPAGQRRHAHAGEPAAGRREPHREAHRLQVGPRPPAFSVAGERPGLDLPARLVGHPVSDAANLEAHRDDAGTDRPELLGGGPRKVEDPALDERAAVVDRDVRLAPRVEIPDPHYGPERQRAVGGGHCPHIVARPGRRRAAVVRLPVPGGDPLLGAARGRASSAGHRPGGR